jgi:CheY-like chemotaxis protein
LKSREVAVGKRSGTRQRPRAIVVDDDRDNRDLYAEYLRHAGWFVVEAMNGADAIAAAIASPPSVIVMDVLMPVLGGIEATRRLKADPRTRHVPVLVLTSSIEKWKVAAEAGCDAYLEKPCLPYKLLEIVEQLVRTPTRRARG